MVSISELFSPVDYNLYTRLVIRGSGLLFVIFNVIVWLGILFWIIYNGKHLSEYESKQSTVNLKVKEPVETNFSSADFDTAYVEPHEFQYYNRIWDSEDYSFVFPNEIHVITNLIITANQTQSVCPESPLIANTLCDPNNNHCSKGRTIKHGIETGKCVAGDFKYFNESTHQWINCNNCQIRGWCPVERMIPPLKNYAAILNGTQDNTLWLKNTINFEKFDIVLDNEFNPDLSYYLKCRYNPITDPLCPIFILRDIVKYAQNNNQSYEWMARFGAIINIKIEWKCFYPVFRSFNQIKDCQLNYSFVRIDDETSLPTAGYTSYREIFLYNDGQTRTHWRTYRLRLIIEASALMEKYNWFQFMTTLFAYYGVYSIFLTIIAIYIRRYLQRNMFYTEEEFTLRPFFHSEESEEVSEVVHLIQNEDLNSEHSSEKSINENKNN